MKTYTVGPCDACGYTAGPSKTEKLAAHGLRMHSCAKELERQASARRGAARHAAVDRTPKPCLHKRASHEHGTHACYVLDRCRCAPCSRANASYERTRARRHAYGRFDTYVDAQPVRDHVRHLLDAGIGLKRIATVAAVSQSALGKLIYGTSSSTPSARTTRAVADKVLAVRVTLDTYAPGARVPNVGTQRRLQALMATGWSQSELSRRVGMEVRNFGHLLHGKRAVTAKNARIVADLYEQLWNQTPPADSRWHVGAVTRSKNYATAHGFAPPMAWDDDLLDDPAAVPDVAALNSRSTRRVVDLVEDVTWYLREVDAMATAEQVAHRFGYRDRSGIQNALSRAGTPGRELLDQLARNAELAGHTFTRRTT